MNQQPPLTVVKSNSLIEATYRLTLSEQRLILLAIAHIDSREEVCAGVAHAVTADDFASVYAVPRKQAYEALRLAVDRLYERSLVIHEPDAVDSSKDYIEIRWIERKRFVGSRGRVEIYFTTGILPFISQLKREFSKYRLAHIAKMSSIYAIRLYEMLIQWGPAGQRQIDLGWLRERLGLGEKYASIRDLKRFVLAPAVDQINECSDLWVKWDQRKHGREVVALIFIFGTKEPKGFVDPRGWIEKNARPGETWEQARDRYYRERR